VADFKMPIKAKISAGEYDFIYPTTQWQTIELRGVHPDEFDIMEDQFYVDLQVRKVYMVPD
jgi:hypothetical protein